MKSILPSKILFLIEFFLFISFASATTVITENVISPNNSNSSLITGAATSIFDEDHSYSIFILLIVLIGGIFWYLFKHKKQK